MYDFDEVLHEVPDNIIQPNSKEHQSLYNLVAGDYGGIRVEVTVGEDGLCRFTNLKNDLPIEGSIRNKSMMDHINENRRL